MAKHESLLDPANPPGLGFASLFTDRAIDPLLTLGEEDKLVQQGVSLHWGRPKYEKLILILIGTTQFCIMRSSAIFKVEKRTTQIGGGGRLSRQWPFKSGIDTFSFYKDYSWR